MLAEANLLPKSAFDDWFNGSKVVDERGNPLVTYHGTESDITTFDPGMTSDFAIYFTPDKNVASYFALNNGRLDAEISAPNVIPVYLSIKNPMVITDAQLELEYDAGSSGKDRDWTVMEQVVHDARENGYDGIHLMGAVETDGSVADQWLAFSGSQVKFAIGSEGYINRVNQDNQGNQSSQNSPYKPQAATFDDWFGPSKVVDKQGMPLAVYRGEHGAYVDGRPQSKLGTYSFTDNPDSASTYAMEPNDHRMTAQAPRVVKAYLSIKNPIFFGQDDPFLELSWLVEKLGFQEAIRIARKFSDRIEYTGNWMDDEDGNFTGYDSVGAFLDDHPDKVNLLYFDAYHFLDDMDEVRLLIEKGFDGAAHIGNGVTSGNMEYRVFHPEQIRSAFEYRMSQQKETGDVAKPVKAAVDGRNELVTNPKDVVGKSQATPADDTTRAALTKPMQLDGGHDFRSGEGVFTSYYWNGDKRQGEVTIHKAKTGYIIRNIVIPDADQRKGLGADIYEWVNQQSLIATGKPLQSSKPRTLFSGSKVFEISEAGKRLWQSLVKKGIAQQLPDGSFSYVGGQSDRLALLEKNGPDAVAKLQAQLAQVEAKYEGLRIKKMYDGPAWDAVSKEAGAIRTKLFEMTGDYYGNPKVKLIKPSDDALNATYDSPNEVPADVRAWVQKNASILTSDATDAVRWWRIENTLNDDRYSSGELTIYRAISHEIDGDEIRAGDWVTTDRKYAEQHLQRWLNGKGRILEESVDGRDVLVSPTGNDEEAIYAPRHLSGKPSRKVAKLEQALSASHVPHDTYEAQADDPASTRGSMHVDRCRA